MKTGLVLEGGAMRGMFTAGVLDVLMEHGIVLDGAIGVSAGAVFGCNYKSHQIGRVIRYNTQYCNDKRYASFGNLLRTGNLYSEQFCYHTVPEKLDVFDAKAFAENPMDFFVVCTDVLAFGIIHLRIPAAIGISFLITLFLGAGKGFDQLYFTTQFLGGGLILGTFFVATDCVTSPITRKGQIWYGVLIGVMTAALRLAGIEEGMVYAILVSNLCVPFIEQLTVPKPFGRRKPVQVTQNRRQP